MPSKLTGKIIFNLHSTNFDLLRVEEYEHIDHVHKDVKRIEEVKHEDGYHSGRPEGRHVHEYHEDYYLPHERAILERPEAHLGESLKRGVVNVGDYVHHGIDSTKEAAHETAQHIKDRAGYAKDKFEDKIEDAAYGVRGSADRLKHSLKQKQMHWSERVHNIRNKVSDSIDRVWDNALYYITGKWLIPSAIEAKQAVEETMRPIKQDLKHAATKIKNAPYEAKEKLEETGDRIKNKVEETGDRIKETGDRIKYRAEQTGDKIKNKIEDFGDQIQDKAEEARYTIRDVEGKIKDKTEGYSEKLRGKISEVKENIKSTVGNIKDTITGKAKHIRDEIHRSGEYTAPVALHDETTAQEAVIDGYEVTYEYHYTSKKTIKPHLLTREINAHHVHH